MKLYIADAFTDHVFGGNPAGVVIMDEGRPYPPEETMVKAAAELRYSETAFIKKLDDSSFELRYFTPAGEVDLCGHATIASFSVLMEAGLVSDDSHYTAKTQAGELSIELQNGFIIMDKGEGLPYVLEQFWISNGTDLVSEDGSQAEGYINSPEGIEAAEFLNSLIQEGYANIDPIQKEFHNERAATMLGGSWEVATLENDYPDLNWGVTYFPVADNGGILTSPTGDWVASVTKNAQDLEAVKEVMQFLFSKENVTTYAQAISKPPTRKSSYDVLTEYNEYPRSLFKEQLMETGHPRPRTPSYSVLSAEFSEALLNIFTGVDTKEALDAAAAATDKDYNKYYAE